MYILNLCILKVILEQKRTQAEHFLRLNVHVTVWICCKIAPQTHCNVQSFVWSVLPIVRIKSFLWVQLN